MKRQGARRVGGWRVLVEELARKAVHPWTPHPIDLRSATAAGASALPASVHPSAPVN